MGIGVPHLGIPDIATDLGQRVGLSPEVIAGILRGPNAVPNTRARLSHAFQLRTGRGRIIGAAFQMDVRQTREIEFEYENDVNANGQPADIVPQVQTGQTITLARWDLYDSLMESAFTGFEISMLTDQRRGFRLRETWRSPGSILGARNRRFEYRPCWFQDLGRVVEATGERTVRVNATLAFLRKDKIE